MSGKFVHGGGILRKSLTIISVLLMLAGSDAYAAGDTEITIVASGALSPLEQTGLPVAVIGAEEIERVQGGDITHVLQRLPGVSLSRNGGMGSFTGMRVRGANAEQLLVLVDGIRIADTAAPTGGFDLGALLPAGVRKVELLRGANSTIWGSDAMAGVLAIETGMEEGGNVSAEYGGPDTREIQGSVGASSGRLDLALDAAFLESEGISSAASGSEPDGLRQWQAGLRAGLRLKSGWSLRGTLRHIDARVELDGFPAPVFVLSDTAEYQEARHTLGSMAAEYGGERLRVRAIWSRAAIARENHDPAAGASPIFSSRGREDRAQLRGRWTVASGLQLHFGGERGWSRMETPFDGERRSSTSAAYGQLGLTRRTLTVNAGLRFEDHPGFGKVWTFGGDGALDLGGGWRLRASYGEGFKAPSLFQLHSDFGNPALRAERSRGFDAGVELGSRNDLRHFAVSVFRRDSTDLIDFVSCFGTSEGICALRPGGAYENVGEARAEGVEVEAGMRLTNRLRAQAAYSYVAAENRTTGAAGFGKDLARRPRHALSASADWEVPLEGLSVGADLRAVSASYDDAANDVRIGGHAVLTLRAALALGERVDLFGRVENVWNESYQTAAGYGTYGRGAYLGARVRL